MAFVDGTNSPDVLDAADGMTNSSDIAYGLDGDDQIYGLGGSDQLHGGLGADELHGGAGIDQADYFYATNSVSASLADDSLNGGEAWGDKFFSIENLRGSNYNDFLAGNAVNNLLVGGFGADIMYGAEGDDEIWGESDADSILGGDGNDILHGDAAADSIDGGAGVDSADYVSSISAVTVSLLSNTASDGDTLYGIENLLGSYHNDTLIGSAGANALTGRDGADTLNGMGGADVLRGGNGGDVLIGSAGNDLLMGGAGADKFRYTNATFGKDVIQDFQNGVDKIDLHGSGLTFASFTETQVGADLVLSLTAHPAITITLLGITAAQIGAGDFLI